METTEKGFTIHVSTFRIGFYQKYRKVYQPQLHITRTTALDQKPGEGVNNGDDITSWAKVNIILLTNFKPNLEDVEDVEIATMKSLAKAFGIDPEKQEY